MIGALITLIVYILVIGLLYWLAIYVIDNVLPEPMRQMARVVVMVVLAIVIILLLLNFIGVGTGVNFPKLNGG